MSLFATRPTSACGQSVTSASISAVMLTVNPINEGEGKVACIYVKSPPRHCAAMANSMLSEWSKEKTGTQQQSQSMISVITTDDVEGCRVADDDDDDDVPAAGKSSSTSETTTLCSVGVPRICCCMSSCWKATRCWFTA